MDLSATAPRGREPPRFDVVVKRKTNSGDRFPPDPTTALTPVLHKRNCFPRAIGAMDPTKMGASDIIRQGHFWGCAVPSLRNIEKLRVFQFENLNADTVEISLRLPQQDENAQKMFPFLEMDFPILESVWRQGAFVDDQPELYVGPARRNLVLPWLTKRLLDGRYKGGITIEALTG